MNDLISRQDAIDTEGLDEQIRCEMCRNPMHTDRGCDGNCKYDEKLYERIMQILGERIKPLPSAQPELSDVAVSAMAVEEMLKDLLPKRGMWEIEGDEAKTAICEVIRDALEGLWKLPFVKPDSKESSLTQKELDTISRQTAITAIQKAYVDTEGGTDKCAVWKNVGLTNALHIMQDLPSAQPDIIRCKDCYWWTKQEDSLQGRCDRYGMYPTGYWYCAAARERREDG